MGIALQATGRIDLAIVYYQVRGCLLGGTDSALCATRVQFILNDSMHSRMRCDVGHPGGGGQQVVDTRRCNTQCSSACTAGSALKSGTNLGKKGRVETPA